MSTWPQRLVQFLIGEDSAINALGGGRRGQTISGTIGRACGFGGGKPHWWGPILRTLVDGVFGAGHCQKAAEDERIY